MNKEKRQTPYDGFDLAGFINKIRRENLEAKNRKLPEPNPLYQVFIPLKWRENGRRWFNATEISKCLRWAGYKALGEVGIPYTLELHRKMERGRGDHLRLEEEFQMFSLGREIKIFDPENNIKGKCDILARNYITGELFVVDFKTIDDWLFKSRLKRENLRAHLKNTDFYPAMPDDEFQIMLYIRMWRQLLNPLEIPIRFGLVIYENRNDPNQRKSCLVEYDEKLMEKFFAHLLELNEDLDKNENIPPYIPKDAYVHTICPYRLKCPRGQEALAPKLKKRNIPLWKIYELKRRAKQPVAEMPFNEPQLTLLEGGVR